MDSLKRVILGDFVFEVPEQVYEPAEDSFLLIDNVETGKECVLLDMGTGCGILGIIAAKNGSKVVAIDVNPFAVRAASRNARANNVDSRVDFINGDLFNPLSVRAKFDIVAFNAPYLSCETRQRDTWIEYSWDGGRTGRIVIDRFIREVARYLVKDGSVFLVQSSIPSVDESIARFRENGLRAFIAAKHDLPFFETLVLLKAQFLK